MDAKIIGQAIRELSPNAEFSFQESDLSTIDWHSKTTRPSDAEIIAQYAIVEARIQSEVALKATQKEAILARLGLTAEEAQLLLS